MSCPFHVEGAAKPPGSSHSARSESTPKPATPALEEIGEGEPIPQPPERWLTGNLGEINPEFSMGSLWRLADVYGPIFTLNLVKRKIVVLSSHALINEVCDEKRFEKKVAGAQEAIRVFVKNGLFTSYNEEEEWGIAHRTLLPAFGPLHVRTMFPKMTDILSQMILRWDRFGPDYRISTHDDFTRLAFDVIGLCAFNYRFNAFYSEELIPFAKQLGDVLIETGKRTSRPEIQNTLAFLSKRQMMENIHSMWKVCDDIVAERKANPRPDVDDTLNVMLNAKDPVTGKGFTDENIRYQMATFLVAGHDTSAGTMMFLFYNLLKNPEALQKCYAEVDAVLGDRELQLEDIPKLKYIDAAMKEALRFCGPIPAFMRQAKETTIIGGKYKVTPNESLVFNLKGLHNDPAVWGSDAAEFRPERFLNGGWERLPPNSWKPFGTGVRSCIGRYLAEQEVLITMAMVLQRFVIEMADPDYELKIKSTLTIKPDEFYIKARRRPGKDHLFNFSAGAAPAPAPSSKTANRASANSNLKPFSVFYGGNSGTCKSFAEDLETNAANHGLSVPAKVQSLDDAVENLPKDHPIVIVTSSYEGLPPDNARNFVAWLETRAKDPSNSELLKGVSYAVFGAGNKDWASTYHRIPKLVDELLEKLGAARLVPTGFVDVSQDIVGPLEEWKLTLFPALREAVGVTAAVKTEELQVEITQPTAPSKLAGEQLSQGLVLVNKVLAKKGLGPEKRQIDILLPPGVQYRSGDYLAIQPFNPRDSIRRVLSRFDLHPDDLVTVSGTTKEHLKSESGGPISVFELIGTRVELANPASQRQVAHLASLSSGLEADKLRVLASDEEYPTSVLAKRFSVLDLLEDFPSCKLSFASYLDMLSPLSPRQYSISSSPLAQKPLPDQGSGWSSEEGVDLEKASLTATLTYDVYNSPLMSHPETKSFNGVSSSYLASLQPGSRLRCFVRKTNAPFRLPSDPATPVVMVAAGTGIAPMRAFLQERAAVAGARGGYHKSGLGPAVLYYGCRDSEEDYLYKEELGQWEKEGVVRIRAAFSRRAGEGGRTGHVDELIWEDREELKGLIKQGAKILVCGSAGRLGRSTAEVCLRIYEDEFPDRGREGAEEWIGKMKEERYVSDVFG
ncbi:Putative bifunctional cytchrome P450 E-class, group I:NADPH-P450 reductase [Podospora comata]|uniref:Bifunctional cytochrome P450/NADPH--P450 reductase n=1 Tax=Podospora comata TaxID=48703 RepID=A0ABY6RW46_PODCO|nr:Putative bifunctional cytchrome P450 E-class, group I:NADPH-P450 reductase [Podospora comata]